MKRISNLIFLVISILFFLSFDNTTCIAADNPSVSGTLTLPSGMTAPSGGLTAELTLYMIQNEDPSVIYFIKVIDATIPEGANSVDYTFNFTDDYPGKPYTVGYEIQDTKGLLLVPKANYRQYENSNKPNGEEFQLSSSGKEHVNLTIYAARTINGTASLPDGLKAEIPEGWNAGSISFDIQVYGAKSGTMITQQNVSIPSGQNSVDFSLSIPAGTAEKQFILGYDSGSYSYATSNYIHFGGDRPWMSGILPYGYYKKDGTAAFRDEATPVDTDSGNINLVLSACKTISGKITDPTVASSSDMNAVYKTQVIVKAIEAGNSSHEFSIPVNLNGNSSTYNIDLPQSDKKFYISYSLFSYGGKGPVASSGFYSNSGTVSYKENATGIQIGGDVRNINLRLLIMRTISGKISLPKGMKAPSKGLVFKVGAVPDYMMKDPVTVPGYSYYIRAGATSFTSSRTFTMKRGESSVSYSILVPANALTCGYKLFYSINVLNGMSVNKIGYLSTKGVSSLIKDGSFLDVSGADEKDADLTILKKGQTSIEQATKKPGSVTGYDRSVPIKMYSGSSSITIDNSNSQSGIYAKLYYVSGGKLKVARVFNIKKGDKFTLVNLSAGTYELHVRDVTTMEQYKTDLLTLDESDGKTTDMTIKINSSTNGNLKVYPINNSEF